MISKVQTSKTEYTLFHPCYAQLCEKSKCLQHSMKYLEANISTFHIPPHDSLDHEAQPEESKDPKGKGKKPD